MYCEVTSSVYSLKKCFFSLNVFTTIQFFSAWLSESQEQTSKQEMEKDGKGLINFLSFHL